MSTRRRPGRDAPISSRISPRRSEASCALINPSRSSRWSSRSRASTVLEDRIGSSDGPRSSLVAAAASARVRGASKSVGSGELGCRESWSGRDEGSSDTSPLRYDAASPRSPVSNVVVTASFRSWPRRSARSPANFALKIASATVAMRARMNSAANVLETPGDEVVPRWGVGCSITASATATSDASIPRDQLTRPRRRRAGEPSSIRSAVRVVAAPRSSCRRRAGRCARLPP